MGISSGNREVIIGQVQKNDASEIIRAVREEQTEYIVTYHGQPVAVIRSAVETQLVVVAGPRAELRAALVALTRLT